MVKQKANISDFFNSIVTAINLSSSSSIKISTYKTHLEKTWIFFENPRAFFMRVTKMKVSDDFDSASYEYILDLTHDMFSAQEYRFIISLFDDVQVEDGYTSFTTTKFNVIKECLLELSNSIPNCLKDLR